MEWPGDASVSVSVVHLERGSVCTQSTVRLDGLAVEEINAMLRAGVERPPPAALATNHGGF